MDTTSRSRGAEADPPSATESVYAVSDFTSELVDDLARSGYGARGWKEFLARSWARSLDDIRAVPARARSTWRWILVGGVAAVAIIAPATVDHGSLRALALWLPWYAAVAFFVLTHLGMVDDRDGSSRRSLLLPNGLSFLRLGLAPLVLWPCLIVPSQPATGLIFALFVIALALTDVLDGWLARRQGALTRMGRMLDPMADLAFLGFLATGLLAAGLLPLPLFILLMLRYPGTLLGVLILYFVRGPAPLPPTFIGKAASLAVNVVLVSGAFSLLQQPSWLPREWVDFSVGVLYPVVGVNLLYLLYRMTSWKATLPA